MTSKQKKLVKNAIKQICHSHSHSHSQPFSFSQSPTSLILPLTPTFSSTSSPTLSATPHNPSAPQSPPQSHLEEQKQVDRYQMNLRELEQIDIGGGDWESWEMKNARENVRRMYLNSLISNMVMNVSMADPKEYQIDTLCCLEDEKPTPKPTPTQHHPPQSYTLLYPPPAPIKSSPIPLHPHPTTITFTLSTINLNNSPLSTISFSMRIPHLDALQLGIRQKLANLAIRVSGIGGGIGGGGGLVRYYVESMRVYLGGRGVEVGIVCCLDQGVINVGRSRKNGEGEGEGEGDLMSFSYLGLEDGKYEGLRVWTNDVEIYWKTKVKASDLQSGLIFIKGYQICLTPKLLKRVQITFRNMCFSPQTYTSFIKFLKNYGFHEDIIDFIFYDPYFNMGVIII